MRIVIGPIATITGAPLRPSSGASTLPDGPLQTAIGVVHFNSELGDTMVRSTLREAEGAEKALAVAEFKFEKVTLTEQVSASVVRGVYRVMTTSGMIFGEVNADGLTIHGKTVADVRELFLLIVQGERAPFQRHEPKRRWWWPFGR